MTEAAKILGVHPWTLRRWIYTGRAPSIVTETSRRFIPTSWLKQQLGERPDSTGCRCAIYARESSSENKAALASQMNGLRRYAEAKGWHILHVIQEIGSGVNDDRPKLHALLAKHDFDVLLVEHTDRLTRFGFRWFEALSPFRIEVVTLAENATHDLMDDLVAILTSCSARLYGQRRGRKKTEAAIKTLQEGES